MGYYPPPLGGISVHVKRLGELLEKLDIDHRIYAIGGRDFRSRHLETFSNRRKWSLRYLFRRKEDLIHCHTMGWSEKAFYLILAKLTRRKILYTFHSYRDGIQTQKGIYRWSLKFVRRFGDAFIAVGRDDYDKMLADGFDEKRMELIPGFIAPVDEPVELPSDISGFMKEQQVVLCANAANMNRYSGEDLYGIDLCVELVGRLKEKGKDRVGCVFFLADATDLDYFERLKDRVKELGVVDRFLFTHDKIDFYQVMRRCDIFIRPTNTDGDAISVREALYYGVPAIASDVVRRPEGTLTFKNRDIEDLVHVTEDAIVKLQDTDTRASQTLLNKGRDYGMDIIRIYEKLLACRLTDEKGN